MLQESNLYRPNFELRHFFVVRKKLWQPSVAVFADQVKVIGGWLHFYDKDHKMAAHFGPGEWTSFTNS